MIVRKGISPLIAAVLLIAFTISVAGLFGQWVPGLIGDVQEGVSEDSSSLSDAANMQLDVSRAGYNSSSGNLSLSVTNRGSAAVENLTATAYGNTPVQKQVDTSLDPGEVTSFEIEVDSEPDSVNIDVEDYPVSAETRDISTSSDSNGDGDDGPKVVDNFNDGDLSEYSGDTSVFSTTSSAYEGDYALHATSTTDNSYYLTSTSGLDNYPSQGDTFQLWIKADDYARKVIHWGISSEGSKDGYRLLYNTNNAGGPDMSISDPNGNIASKNSVQMAGSWYRWKIDWQDDNTINWTIYDSSGNMMDTLSGSSGSSVTSGGIGFASRSGCCSASSDHYWDNWIIL